MKNNRPGTDHRNVPAPACHACQVVEDYHPYSSKATSGLVPPACSGRQAFRNLHLFKVTEFHLKGDQGDWR